MRSGCWSEDADTTEEECVGQRERKRLKQRRPEEESVGRVNGDGQRNVMEYKIFVTDRIICEDEI